jgi:hypothetical protein
MPLVDDLVFNLSAPYSRCSIAACGQLRLDRPALAQAFYDDPNDQILPPGVPGRRASVHPVRGH